MIISVKYPGNDPLGNTATKSEIDATYDKDFGQNLNDATWYKNNYKIGSIDRCYYDPDSPKHVLFDINYSAWKWVLFGFPAFGLLVTLICITGYGLGDFDSDSYHSKNNYKHKLNFCLWVGILLPLVFFLPLRQLGKIDETAKTILLYFICNFIGIGFGPVIIELSWEFIGNINNVLLISLYALLVYVPIGILIPISINISSTFLILTLISFISVITFIVIVLTYNNFKSLVESFRIPEYSITPISFINPFKKNVKPSPNPTAIETDAARL